MKQHTFIFLPYFWKKLNAVSELGGFCCFCSSKIYSEETGGYFSSVSKSQRMLQHYAMPWEYVPLHVFISPPIPQTWEGFGKWWQNQSPLTLRLLYFKEQSSLNWVCITNTCHSQTLFQILPDIYGRVVSIAANTTQSEMSASEQSATVQKPELTK